MRQILDGNKQIPASILLLMQGCCVVLFPQGFTTTLIIVNFCFLFFLFGMFLCT